MGWKILIKWLHKNNFSKVKPPIINSNYYQVHVKWMRTDCLFFRLASLSKHHYYGLVSKLIEVIAIMAWYHIHLFTQQLIDHRLFYWSFLFSISFTKCFYDATRCRYNVISCDLSHAQCFYFNIELEKNVK